MNLNDQSIMSDQINKSAAKDNKYLVDLETNRPNFENKAQYNYFKPNEFSKIDGGKSIITDTLATTNMGD